jgi:selenocysteine lyase/cysteine desulfurase
VPVPGLRREDFPALEAIAAELTRRGVIVSPRVGSTRFSMHFYNDSDDVDRALAALDLALR